jgi:hypothetical protein
MKGTVDQFDVTRSDAGLIAAWGQDGRDPFEAVRRSGFVRSLATSTNGPPERTRRDAQGIGYRDGTFLGLSHSLSEDRCRQLVAPFGHAEDQLADERSVKFGGSTRARAASSRGAAILNGKEAYLHELVHVKGSHRTGDPEGLSGLGATHKPTSGRDIDEQTAPELLR